MARIALSFVVFSSLLSFAACSDDGGGGEQGGNNNTSGSGNTTGGTNSTGGSTSTAGTGATTAGTTSTAGSTSTGGTGGSTGFTCAGTMLTAAEITDFTTIGAMNTWGTPPALNGGLFAYPEAAMTVDASGGNMHVSGNVANYSGFGIWFAACSDASTFDGISFDISGNVGPSAKIGVTLQTHSDYPIDTVAMKGGCAFATEMSKYTDCVTPIVTKDVPQGGGTITVAWSEFVGGKPVATADPSEIIGIQWVLGWAGATDTAYDADVTLDNVKFMGDTSGGGAGGTPGAGGSGEGGAPAEGGAGGQGGA